jgi:hypothetical protein
LVQLASVPGISGSSPPSVPGDSGGGKAWIHSAYIMFVVSAGSQVKHNLLAPSGGCNHSADRLATMQVKIKNVFVNIDKGCNIFI